jgi:lipoyl(octanoyl) transferase
VPEFVIAGFDPDFVSYNKGLELQRETHREVVARQRPDTVILLEHTSVYTAGKRTEDSERPDDGTEVIEVDRGGKLTWHGPGQLVGYPIMRLPEPFDVVGYVRFLEQVLIDVCADFGLATERVEGRSGVWATHEGSHLKIAAIGIRDAGTSSISELTGEWVTPAMAAERVKIRLTDVAKVVL